MSRPNTIHLAGLLAMLAGPAVAAELSVQEVIAKEAAILTNMHRKASSALVNVAQDPAFAALFAAVDEPSRTKLKNRVDQISLRTQASFQVGEMCLIGADGAERSRIVGRQIATDLDADEARNEFFSPTMKARPRTVYIPRAYLSDDTKAWVVAYATPITFDATNVGLMHYEHRLDEYQRELDRGAEGTNTRLMAVDETGHVLIDTADEPPTAARKEENEDAYFKAFSLAGGDLNALRARLNGGPAGYGRIETGETKLDVAYQGVQGWTVVGVRDVAGEGLAGHKQAQD